MTSSLPRKRSTTELLRLVSSLSSFRVPCLFRAPGRSAAVPACLERKTGLEPATYSLEGYRSTKWATSACILSGRGGDWTRTNELRRGQIYSLLQLPLCDFPMAFVPNWWEPEPMKGLEPPTGWLQISYSTNWVTSAAFTLSIFSSIVAVLTTFEVAKILLFCKLRNIFSTFFRK